MAIRVAVIVVAVTPTSTDPNVAAVGVRIRAIVRIWVRIDRVRCHSYPHTEPDPRVSMRRSEERQHPRQCYNRDAKFSEKRLHFPPPLIRMQGAMKYM
jgi:hypothetical protein